MAIIAVLNDEQTFTDVDGVSVCYVDGEETEDIEEILYEGREEVLFYMVYTGKGKVGIKIFNQEAVEIL